MSPPTCFLYGHTLEGVKSSLALAPELQTGRVYSFYLNTRPSDSSDSTHGQDAKFCFMPDPAGGCRLIEVKYGMRAWDTGRCE